MLQRLQSDLRKLGIELGDVVMMHSSFKSLGAQIAPDDFFRAFMEVLGPEGTLLLPALSYESVSDKQPVFDREQTPSCVGFLPEYFRTNVPGVIRSFHPTHSVCAKGKLAAELTADHQWDRTPVGAHSPIAKLPKAGGKILFLGCDPDHNTALHGVEEAADVPYVFDRSRQTEFILKDGSFELHRKFLCHDFVKKDHWLKQRYGRIIELLPKKSRSFGKVLQADCVLLDAAAVWRFGIKKMEEDPYYFVERINEIL